MADALFEPIGDDRYLPTDMARGPWSPDALHGGPTAALLARVAEPALEGLHPARVTVELLRPVPAAAQLCTAVRVIRPGRKVRLVGSEVRTDDGTVVATAMVLGIRRADVSVPAIAAPPVSVPPLPDTVATATVAELGIGTDWEAFHNVGVEQRFVAGSLTEPGPATDWIRLRVPVVHGEDTTPLERVMAAADFGNGVSSVADFQELAFINADLTVHLHRLPAGEWVGLEAATRLEGTGVGLAQSELWDEHGPLGRALQSLLVEARR